MDFKVALSQIIGKKIKELRQEADVNQEKLAEEIGLNRTSISNIEAGRQLAPLDVLYKLCHTLDTELHFLLPTYKEVSQFVSKIDSPFEKLKTNNVSEGSIEFIKNILDKYKQFSNQLICG